MRRAVSAPEFDFFKSLEMADVRTLITIRYKRTALLRKILLHEYLDDNAKKYVIIRKLFERKSRPELVKIIGFFELTVPAYFDDDFRRHFRLSRTIFDALTRHLAPLLVGNVFGRPEIVLEKEMMIVLWLFRNMESFRSIGDRFHVSRSTVESCFQQVIQALNLLSETVILWPAGRERQDVINGFANGAGFPGVVGAIDGTHIRITAPREDQAVYVNRKQHHSIVLQALCNDRLFFTDCSAALSGILFPGKEEAAYSNFRLWEATGSLLAYAYSPYLCTNIKLYILLAILCFGISGYIAIIRIGNASRNIPNDRSEFELVATGEVLRSVQEN